MAIEFKLPELGEGIEAGDVVNVLVKPGDVIEAEQSVLELETDKAVVEIPSPHAGVIETVNVKSGDKVAVGAVVLTLNDNGAPAAGKAKTETKKQTIPPPSATQPAPPPEPVESTPLPTAQKIASGPIGFNLPELGEGIEAGDVVNVLVKPGDTIEADQSVIELETDKAVVEVPCPYSGQVLDVAVKSGDKVAVGARLLTVQTGAESSATKSKASKPGPPIKPVESQREIVPQAQQGRTHKVPYNHDLPKMQGMIKPSSDNDVPPPAVPSVRKMARDLGVNLNQVQGSGAEGRIRRDDVKTFVHGAMSGQGRRLGAGVEIPLLPDFSQWGPVERKPLTGIRKAIARNMSVSWALVPHVTQFDETDITEMEAARRKYGVTDQVKITITVLALKAVVAALKQFPQFNASLDPETHELIYKMYYHIGIAVDTPHGLMVPVIRDVDQKNIHQLAVELNEAALKARDRKLSPDEMKGGTFTITNLGGIGGTAFTPIVNYPEVAILGLCRAKKQQQWNNGEVEDRLIMPVCLSYDHRVIDGADGARFLRMIAASLCDPFQLLLET
ncbi:dihydrolipoyllysine-residue acetyltransferase [Candidatus Sumerlaeota bacterium]|nr:dihydrolipoyllysine-residue acetyltransferase [Candidatus Sumerlaeota bacterium]